MDFFRLFISTTKLLLALTTAAFSQSTLQQEDRVIFVLDGSGSMWGQIDGIAKITIARDMMSELIADWPQDAPIGLVAYGHRRKGDCKDIELIQPVSIVDRTALSRQVQGINALGKTPLSASLAFAAVQAGWTFGKTDVVLVTDGLETCDANPCAMAASLARQGFDFTVHVIGFDVTEEESAQLSCIADATGGSFLRADSASGLADALQATTTAAIAPKPAQVIEQPKPTTAPQILFAKLCEACDPLDALQVSWSLRDGGSPVYDGLGLVNHTRSEDLSPGRYSGTVQLISGALSQPVEVVINGDGTQNAVVNLDGGFAQVKALMSADSSTNTNSILFTYTPLTDGVEGVPVERSGRQDEGVILRAGRYRVTAQIADIMDRTDIVIQAGQTTNYTFDMRVGYAAPRVAMSPGGKVFVGGIHYGIFRNIEGATANVGQLLAGAGGHAKPLRPGNYGMRLEVYGAGLEGKITRIVPIEIKAGETTDMIVDLNSGYLDHTITSSGLGFSVFVLEYFAVDAAGNTLELNSKSIYAKAKARLPDGRYELRIFNHGEYYYSDPFDVRAGETTTLAVTIP